MGDANPITSLYRQWAATAANRTALGRLLGSLITSLVLTSNFLGATLLVSPDGDDATGQRGTQQAFKTIQAAVTASSDGDLILVGPGTYAETVTVPPTRTSLVIRGLDRANTAIVPPALQGIVYKPTGSGTLVVEDLTIASPTTALDFTPPTSGAFVARTIVRRCTLTGTTAGLLATNAFSIQAEDTTVGILTVTDCEQARLVNCVVTTAVFDVQAAAVAGLDHTGYLLEGGRYATLTHTGRALVESDASVYVGTYTATGLTSTAVIGAGILRFYGKCDTFNLNLPAAQQATPLQPVVDLRGSQLGVTTFATAGTSGDATFTADARGATIDSTTINSTGTQNIVLDVRSGQLTTLTAFNAAARCFIDRDVVCLGSLAVATGGTAFVFGTAPLANTLGFGPANTSYELKLTETAAIAAVADLATQAAKAATGFTILQTNGGAPRNVQVTLLRSTSP